MRTFIKYGTAQNQIVVYDMYTRFYRWAMDRVQKNAVIAFITNRSFIDSRAFDGFRKCIQTEFDYAYIIDTKSDVRANPKIAGTSHNVFGIQTGVAVMFLVRKEEIVDKNCRIEYTFLPDEMLKEDKLSFFKSSKLNGHIPFTRIQPDAKNNWINQADNDWGSLLPMMDKHTKNNVSGANAMFGLFSRGIETGRDEWIYDLHLDKLSVKIRFFIDKYNVSILEHKKDFSIKWTHSLESCYERKVTINYNDNFIKKTLYRPFFKIWGYCQKELNHRLTQNHYDIFGADINLFNQVIIFSGVGFSKPFTCLATDRIWGLDTLEKTQGIPLYRYSADGERVDNITDWGAEQVRKHYGDASISKEEIFEYVYAVLHNPAYRKKYELNLKREFPRLPFYADFRKWAAWGKELMRLHIDYENVEPFILQRNESDKPKDSPRPKLKADKEAGIIFIDENTQLTGIPPQAWRYMLGNRSALEWVLDQYKESKISDPTVAELFDNYRFSDYKEQVIDLLARLCTVSLRTVDIESQMNELQPIEQATPPMPPILQTK